MSEKGNQQAKKYIFILSFFQQSRYCPDPKGFHSLYTAYRLYNLIYSQIGYVVSATVVSTQVGSYNNTVWIYDQSHQFLFAKLRTIKPICTVFPSHCPFIFRHVSEGQSCLLLRGELFLPPIADTTSYSFDRLFLYVSVHQFRKEELSTITYCSKF